MTAFFIASTFPKELNMMPITRVGNQSVAILSRNKVAGYFVPKSALDIIELELASTVQVTAFIEFRLAKMGHVIDYLYDK